MLVEALGYLDIIANHLSGRTQSPWVLKVNTQNKTSSKTAGSTMSRFVQTFCSLQSHCQNNMEIKLNSPSHWVALFTITAAVVAATWQVTLQTVSSELRTYQALHDLDAVKTIQELRTLSASIAAHSETIAKHGIKEAEAERFRKEIPELRSEVQSLKAENSELARRLATYTGETFTLNNGDTRALIPKKLFIGVDYMYSKSCTINIGDKTQSVLSVGEHRILKLENQTMFLNLVSVSARGCEFSLNIELNQ